MKRTLFALFMVAFVTLPQAANAEGGRGGANPPICAKAGQDCSVESCCPDMGLYCWWDAQTNSTTCQRFGPPPQPIVAPGLLGALVEAMQRALAATMSLGASTCGP